MLAAEYALSIATWVVLLGDLIVELNCYVKQRTWLVRFPILFIFAGEVAKLRWCSAVSAPMPQLNQCAVPSCARVLFHTA